ncbi:MAG: hypothetical protein ABIP97_07790, partial [Chthoniobacterales bacterium]
MFIGFAFMQPVFAAKLTLTPDNAITLHVFAVSMPNAEANQFSAKYNLANQTSGALVELRQLVEQKKATRINFP